MRSEHKVLPACVREVAQFCPTLAADASKQSQIICLKYYKTSLGLGCRKVVAAGK